MLTTMAAFAITLITLADPPPPERKEPPTGHELARIAERGRLLAEYDAAAWHASDALQAKKPKENTLQRDIARKIDKGWVVAFGRLDDEQNQFLVSYEATQGKGPEDYEVKAYEPPKPDTGFFRSAAKAIDVALKDFVENFKGKQRPYNVAVLPAEEGQFWVYLVPAPTRPGVWPLGGDVRYLMSPEGARVVEKRQLHNSIIEKEMPKEDAANKVAMGYHTHVLDDVPEDTDVFHVLTRKPAVPEIIATRQFVFQIDASGAVKYLGKAEELLQEVIDLFSKTPLAIRLPRDHDCEVDERIGTKRRPAPLAGCRGSSHWRMTMPSFTYAQWKTWVTDKHKGTGFERVDDSAKRFLTNPSKTAARSLRTVLDQWKASKTNWKLSVRNRDMGHGPAIEVLSDEVNYYLNQRAADVLSAQATLIFARLSGSLDATYRRKLDEVFIQPKPRVQNVAWFDTSNGDQTFETRYKAIVGSSGYAASGVKAFTATLKTPNDSVPDVNDLGSAPANRIIVLRPAFVDSTACHELFHWLTHDLYEKEALKFQGDENKAIIEGVTEFFTRKVRTDRDASNYGTEFDRVNLAIASGDITENDLAEAYFQGQNTAGVIDGLRSCVIRDAIPKKYQDLPFILKRREPSALPADLQEYVKRTPIAKLAALVDNNTARVTAFNQFKAQSRPLRTAQTW